MKDAKLMFPASPVCSSKHQLGFTLIELMVALVIGLIIILGAGQLFLMGFQTFRQVELLGNKQAALTFATEMLVRDIRRADNSLVQWDDANGELQVGFVATDNSEGCTVGEDVGRVYELSSDSTAQEGFTLMLTQTCNGASANTEPLVSGFANSGFDVDDTNSGSGIYSLSFCLMDEPGNTEACEQNRLVTFRAVNRNAAID